jgi:hypothetical protein
MRSRLELLIALAAAGPLGAQQSAPGTLPKGESQQVVDSAFVAPHVGPPAYAAGAGPRIVIDEAHHNFHTVSGRYRPFATLLERDGFRVEGSRERFTRASLAQARVLVVANSIDPAHERQPDWRLPAVSAFDASEIAATVEWVRDGGALLLIADHMPFAGAATALAAAFGVELANGFALFGDADPRTGDYPIVFRRADGTLRGHRITNGRSARERIDSLESFTGSAFRVRDAAGADIMRLPAGTRVRLPVEAWKFSDSTAEIGGAGLLQGAAFRFGRGRVAVFGEAAMFSAQRKGSDRVPMGMNSPAASQNPQFILNVMRWLAQLYD